MASSCLAILCDYFVQRFIVFVNSLEGMSLGASRPTPSCQATRQWGGFVFVEVMWSGGLFALILVTTHGEVKLLPARPVSSTWSTMHQTMSLWGLKPLWRVSLCKLMLPHSSSGTSLTMELTSVGKKGSCCKEGICWGIISYNTVSHYLLLNVFNKGLAS